MANEGFFEFGLIDTAGNRVVDSKVTVKFIRGSDNKTISHAKDLEFPPSRVFRVPAFPQEQNLLCEVTPSKWRQRTSDFFTLTDGETIVRNLTVFRKPDKWSAQFLPWSNLPVQFVRLQHVLHNSPDVKIRGGKTVGLFTESTYDAATDPKSVIAKTGLLNLYVKLANTKEPTGGNEDWFSFVEQMLEIGRERFIALARPEMGERVQAIRQNIGDFPDYIKAPAFNHFGNMPSQFGVSKSKMFSIKSKEDKGNLQLTLGPGKDANGKDVLVLDADIDEDGRLFAHLASVFRHKVTGQGTHPHDIHEYLKLSFPGVPLGYELA
jgi:hypothetical protein